MPDSINYSSIEFQEGVLLGKSLGENDAYRQAKVALHMGEIELWLEYMEPKTLEDWDAWREKHGEDFEERWEQ